MYFFFNNSAILIIFSLLPLVSVIYLTKVFIFITLVKNSVLRML